MTDIVILIDYSRIALVASIVLDKVAGAPSSMVLVRGNVVVASLGLVRAWSGPGPGLVRAVALMEL